MATYLWVNKNQDSSSLSCSKGDEYHIIREHVQSVVAKRRQPRSEDDLAQLQNTLSTLIGSAIDPFTATTLAVHEDARRLLTFHIDWWTAVSPNWKTWHEVDLLRSADIVVSEKCFQNPLYMLAVITFTSTQMRMLKLPGSQTCVPDALNLKTIAALREAVDELDPMHLLEVVSYLCLVEVFNQDFDATRVHLRAVRRLLQLSGGLGNVLNHISEMFLFCDFHVAMSNLEKPILGKGANLSDSPPLPVPRRHLKYGWIRRLPQEIRMAVQQLSYCVDVLYMSWTNPKQKMNGYWVRKKCVSIILGLLHAKSTTEIPRIVVLLWTACVLSATLDAQGTKDYIPLFEFELIEMYRPRWPMVAYALRTWNTELSVDSSMMPDDGMMKSLMKAPALLENSGGVHLTETMMKFADFEVTMRNEKIKTLDRGQVERSWRWRTWRTSILLL